MPRDPLKLRASEGDAFSLDRVDIVDDGDNPGARITLFKRREPTVPDKTPQDDPQDVTKALEAFEAKLQDGQAERDAAVTKSVFQKLKELFKADEPAPTEDEKLTAMEKRLADKNATLEAEIVKLRQERERDQVIHEVSKALGEELADDFAPVVLKAKQAFSADEYAKFMKMLTTARKVVEGSVLFKELGIETDNPAPPAEKLEALAKQRAQENKITYHEAYSQVLDTDEGQALYDAYQAEQRGR